MGAQADRILYFKRTSRFSCRWKEWARRVGFFVISWGGGSFIFTHMVVVGGGGAESGVRILSKTSVFK